MKAGHVPLMDFFGLHTTSTELARNVGQPENTRDPVSGTVYLLMLAVFAIMPWLISRRRIE